MRVYRHHRRPGGIECDCRDIGSRDSGLRYRLAHGCRERAHVIVVRLGGVLGIFSLAMERIFADGRGQRARGRCPRSKREH